MALFSDYGMTGEYQHTIDAKGRLFIPAKLREELGEVFFVTIAMDPCLSLYSLESWSRFKEKFDGMPYSKARKMRPLFANAARCELDKQGRILIPQKLRDYAGLKKDVTVIGVSNRAEIWDSARWREVEEAELTAENLQDIMSELEL